MKKILIVSNTNPNSNPRPNRMIHWLKDHYEVEVVGLKKLDIDGIKSHVIEPFPPVRNARTFFLTLKRIIKRNINLPMKNYEEVNWSRLGNARNLANQLMGNHYDLIISHDLVLLPFIFMIKNETTRVLFDAREYYPRNFDDNLYWKLTKKTVNHYLCSTYLHRCDKMITVSQGLADEYQREYGVKAEVVMSLPYPQNIFPSQPEPGVIRMIHHGNASPSRKTEMMIEMMDFVDDRFTLDLMMMVINRTYWNKIVKMVEQRPNVRIVPPVSMQEIVPTISHYDIGLFLVPPTNFNLKHTLPNKLFEFIQARLAVAIGPSIDMKKIVDQYKCGIVSSEFNPQSLAAELNKLTMERIAELKGNSNRAASELNAEVSGKRVQKIVSELID